MLRMGGERPDLVFVGGLFSASLRLTTFCSCFKGPTTARGQDLFRRHRDCHTLEWLHGGGRGSWGESSPRGRALGHGLWERRQRMGPTSGSEMSEILEAKSPVTSMQRPMKHHLNSILKCNEHFNPKVIMKISIMPTKVKRPHGAKRSLWMYLRGHPGLML